MLLVKVEILLLLLVLLLLLLLEVKYREGAGLLLRELIEEAVDLFFLDLNNMEFAGEGTGE